MVHTAIRALSMDIGVAHSLATGVVRGEIHSVFNRVINLISREGQLISVCTRTLDDAPWSVRIDLDDWSGHDLSEGDTVEIVGDSRTISPQRSLVIDARTAIKWDARSTSLPHAPASSVVIEVLEEVLRAGGVAGGAVAASAAVDPFAAVVAHRLAEGIERIAHAEATGDGPALTVAVRGMLGLGPGLTPAGDDVLTGLLLTASRPDSRVTLLPGAVTDVLSVDPECTNVLSRTTLLAAARGGARQSLIDLLGCVGAHCPPSPESLAELRAACERVIAIGHTSGSDLLSGILAGLRLDRDLRGSA